MDSLLASHPAAPNLYFGNGGFFQSCRVNQPQQYTAVSERVDCGISLIVDRTHPVQASGNVINVNNFSDQ